MPHSDLPHEEPLDPNLPIVDAHHHLWDRGAILHLARPARFGWQRVILRTSRYLVDEVLAENFGGHNVIATVHVEASHAYSLGFPEALRPVGETRFVSACADEYVRRGGPSRLCAAIVGFTDLTLGPAVAAVLDGHMESGRGRFREIRHSGAHHYDPALALEAARPGLYRSSAFRRGFAELAPRGLSFDAWLLEPQLGDLFCLASAFPETMIVLNHLGTPIDCGNSAAWDTEGFARWPQSMTRLALLPNVSVKLGGLGMN